MSTSVHFPDALAKNLEAEARRKGISRNRLIIEACRAYLESFRDEWPEEMFDPLPAEEMKELQAATRELEDAIRGSRRSKRTVDL
jgi:hypothetical protein